MAKFHAVGSMLPLDRTRKGRALFELTDPYDFECKVDGVNYRLVVPAGFETDGASIPWGLRNLFPPNGPHTPAAVIHDYLYRFRGRNEDEVYLIAGHRTERREVADRIFKEAMRVRNVPGWRRDWMYRAVRWFGAQGWGS